VNGKTRRNNARPMSRLLVWLRGSKLGPTFKIYECLNSSLIACVVQIHNIPFISFAFLFLGNRLFLSLFIIAPARCLTLNRYESMQVKLSSNIFLIFQSRNNRGNVQTTLSTNLINHKLSFPSDRLAWSSISILWAEIAPNRRDRSNGIAATSDFHKIQ